MKSKANPPPQIDLYMQNRLMVARVGVGVKEEG